MTDEVSRERGNREPEEDIRPLNVDVLRRCGVLISDCFGRFVDTAAAESVNDNGDDDNGDDEDSSWDSSSCCSSAGSYKTYSDLAAERAFHRLYDMMTQHLEMADERYGKPPPRLRLYDNLYDFTHDHSLREINRYVFGNGSCSEAWGPNALKALTTVQTWRKRYKDRFQLVPESLIESYKTASSDPDLQPLDVSMVAYAVFGFLLGYDTKEDFDLMYMLHDVKALEGPVDFRLTWNRACRNARIFLESDTVAEKHRAYFETLAENADLRALCEWIFDLTAGRPEVAKRLAGNPFSIDSADYVLDLNPELAIAPSTMLRLRVLHRWISGKLYTMLGDSGGVLQRRISLLDDHVDRQLWSLSANSWSRTFDVAYGHVLAHFTEVLVEHGCPAPFLDTLRATWHSEPFVQLMRLCAKTFVAENSNLRHRDSSTDSKDDGSSNSDGNSHQNDNRSDR